MLSHPRPWLLACLLGGFCFAALCAATLFQWGTSHELGTVCQCAGLQISDEVRLAAGAFWLTCYSVGSVLGGLAVDRFSARRLFLGSILTVSAGAMLLAVGQAQKLIPTVAGLAGLGMGQGTSYPLAASLLGDAHPGQRRARAMLLLYAGRHFGAALVPSTVIPALYGWDWGWKVTFFSVGLTSLLLGLILYWSLFGRNDGMSVDHGRVGELGSWRKLWRRPTVMMCLVAIAVVAACQV